MKTADFKSWDEYRAALEALPKGYSIVGLNGYEWSAGVNSVGAALEIADKGWPEGMEKARAIALPTVNALADTLHAAGDLVADVTGAAFDVGEFLSGTPECWMRPDDLATKPALSIGYNCCTSGGIGADVLMVRGAAVAALTLALQQSGYAVKVYAIDGGTVEDFDAHKKSEDLWARVCLTDDMGGPLDFDRIVFALAHPAASRQLAYGYEAILSGFGATKTYYLGWPQGGFRARPPEEWKFDLYLHATYLNETDWHDPAAVERWVHEMYEKLTQGGDAQE